MSPDIDVLSEPTAGKLATNSQAPLVPYRQSGPIEFDGIFLGIAVKHHLGVHFIAIDRRVTDMDRSIWPSPDFARISAGQCPAPTAWADRPDDVAGSFRYRPANRGVDKYRSAHEAAIPTISLPA